MDLLQRLIAGSGSAANTSKQQRIPSTTERIFNCKKLCNALQTIWRSSVSLTNDESTINHIATILKRLNAILEDESRKAAPHSCLIYTASNQIYIIVAKLALSSINREVVNSAAHFFNFLINGEVDGVLDSKIFARSVVDLVKRCTAPANKYIDESGESALIELLFEICTKIRLDPDILPAWFYPERGSNQKAGTALDTRRSQFPLFYLLLEYVHYDGPIGDFARTALLYLTETAPRSHPLEKWMLESDLAPQMASGLSAFYGRLSRTTPSLDKTSLPLLSQSDASEFDKPVHDSDDEDLNMRSFLSYLAFCQDTLAHCKSSEVRDTLLDSFQVLFVEQLLYPSLLESSDVQGGSTSAVILHLCRLLDAIDNSQMTSRMLNYLFASKAPTIFKSDRSKQRMSMSRRRSLEQLATFAQLQDNPSPELFSLLDLIVFSVRSDHFQTITSSLKLVSILLRRHHVYVMQQLFPLETPISNVQHNLNELNHVMMTLFDCANAISQVSSLDSSYQAALIDTQIRMEQHSCLVTEDGSTNTGKETMAISPQSRILQQMLVLLESWFTNDALVNLELTSAFAELATCEVILMRTWLTPIEIANTECPSVVSVIQGLIQQVSTWRSQFVEWDAFYSVQRVELCNDDATPSFVESETTRTASPGSLSTTLLDTKLPVQLSQASSALIDDESAVDGQELSQFGQSDDDDSTPKQSLRHILTQSVILQEFILELAAALQIRATLFNEVNLS